MTYASIKRKLRPFDTTGMSKETVRNLYMLIWGIAFGTVCFNITGGIAMTGYLRELGTTDFVFGIIMAISPVAACLQFLTSYLLEKTKKRRTMFIVSGLIQRTVWIPFALVPLFVPGNLPALRVGMAAMFISISALCNPFMNVAFFSLAADVIPMGIRGRYFATRSRISTIVGIIGGLITASILDALPGYPGYMVAFIMAGVFGTADIICFFWMKFPKMQVHHETQNLPTMIKHVFTNTKYMRLIMYFTLWTFSVQISGPFYNVFMRETAHMNNTEITLMAQVSANIVAVFVLSRWGRAMDFYGNKPVIFLNSLICMIIPFIWLFVGPGNYNMVIVTQILAGLAWGATDLGMTNLFIGQAPEKNRSMYMATFFIFTQLFGMGLANAIGGWLLDNVLNSVDTWGLTFINIKMTRYHALFVTSGILRCTCVLLGFKLLMEEGAQSSREIIVNAKKSIQRNIMQFGLQLIRIKQRKLLNNGNGEE